MVGLWNQREALALIASPHLPHVREIWFQAPVFTFELESEDSICDPATLESLIMRCSNLSVVSKGPGAGQSEPYDTEMARPLHWKEAQPEAILTLPALLALARHSKHTLCHLNMAMLDNDTSDQDCRSALQAIAELQGLRSLTIYAHVKSSPLRVCSGLQAPANTLSKLECLDIQLDSVFAVALMECLTRFE